eukprot:SAG31_NODE_18374_length_638_cov_1.725417_1_plen_63_part_10
MRFVIHLNKVGLDRNLKGATVITEPTSQHPHACGLDQLLTPDALLTQNGSWCSSEKCSTHISS